MEVLFFQLLSKFFNMTYNATLTVEEGGEGHYIQFFCQVLDNLDQGF
jgi:hypothetical protein